jgi:hypothetical protein
LGFKGKEQKHSWGGTESRPSHALIPA